MYNAVSSFLLVSYQYQLCVKVFFTSQSQLCALCFSTKSTKVKRGSGLTHFCQIFPPAAVVPCSHTSWVSAFPMQSQCSAKMHRKLSKNASVYISSPGPTSCFGKNSFYNEKQGKANKRFSMQEVKVLHSPGALGWTLFFPRNSPLGGESRCARPPGAAGGAKLPGGDAGSRLGPCPEPGGH